MNRPKELYDFCRPNLVLPITDEEVEEMLAIVKPLKDVEVNGNSRFQLIEIDGVNRKNIAFTWEPKLGRLVRVYQGGLNDTRIVSFHAYGAPALFKPSLMECCAAIKHFMPEWRKGVKFFCVGPGDLTASNVLSCGFHFVPMIVFGDEKPHVIDARWERDARTVEKK